MNILKRPMLYAAIVCSVAAAISLYTKTLAFLILTTTVLCLIFAVFCKKYKYIVVVLSLVLFSVGLSNEFIKINDLNKKDKQKVTGSFLVIDEPVDHGLFNSVTIKELDCDSVSSNVKILLFDYEKTKINIGDIINATLKLSTVKAHNKYRISNYSDGIYVTANATQLEKTDEYNLFYKTMGNIRSYVKNMVSSRFKGDTAGLLLAITTGDKTLLSDEFSANIKTTGISHVVVVSGMHLAIIMMAIFWCLDRLFYNKYIRCVIAILSVILICSVCGFTMSIIRAGVMFIVAGFAPIFNRTNDSLNSLLTAVTIVLICSPFAILNISFQLSVLSTISIIWIVPFYSGLIKEHFKIKSKILNFLIDTFLCSIFAIIFTLPVTIKVFGYISIVSPITNMVIFYPVMLALIFNIVSLVISAIPVINVISCATFFIAGICSRFMVLAVNYIAQLPVTVAVLPQSAFWFSIILIALIIGYMYFYDYRKKRSDLNANSI